VVIKECEIIRNIFEKKKKYGRKEIYGHYLLSFLSKAFHYISAIPTLKYKQKVNF